jgi:UDP-MurNAc hydroxylase
VQLTLVNHACVKIATSDAVILCDPWIDGPAFHDGWDLLVPTPIGFDELTSDVTHVWISHEHPDHFSPKLLARLPRTVTVLFQQTRDGRVKQFCESKGFRVIELAPYAPRAISPTTTVTSAAHDFYDSWLHVSDGASSILDLNDCQLDDPRKLAALRDRLGAPDVLLTQFSYAAWKGGRDRVDYRRYAARRKLATMTAQIRALSPRAVVPFASLVYFSNRENAYLNDAVNDIATAARAIEAAGATALVLYPGDRVAVGTAHDDGPARARYAERFAELPSLPLRAPAASVPIAELERGFAAYRQRVFAANSERLIRLLRRVPLLGAFHPVAVRLTDLDTVVTVSVVDGFRVVPTATPDVSMHSTSLAFVFGNLFGFDTLTVNGRFEATPRGFARMTKSLAIGSLNAMGLSVSPRLLADSWALWLLADKLARVLVRLYGAPSR